MRETIRGFESKPSRGLKKGSAACRWMERVDVDDRHDGNEAIGVDRIDTSCQENRRSMRLQRVSVNEQKKGVDWIDAS